ncbi:MAG TPA: hypothetical protein VGJ20_34525 [Xanthobacteraceae bacterium]|jgi:hypothetical protein
MHLEDSVDLNFGFAEVDADDGRRRVYFAVGFLCSAVLHGFVLLVFLSAHDRPVTSPDIPMDVVVLADETASPLQPAKALAPQERAELPSLPAAEPIGALPSNKRPDDLEVKLRALAMLRQPSLVTKLSKKNLGLSHLSATSNDATVGPYATYAVGDFIRAQVERRWSLDLMALGKSSFSVLIRVGITSAGVVTKAEILDMARFNADKTYRKIALSARNAVLLSSPFVLPPGHYSDVMDLIISLNTKEALR